MSALVPGDVRRAADLGEVWAVRPLPRADELVDPPQVRELALARVPVVGWIAGRIMWGRRIASGGARARAILAGRPHVPPEAWDPDPARQEFAYYLTTVLAERAGWGDVSFVPGDPMCTLCHLGSTQNLSAIVRLALSDRLGRRLSSAEWDWVQKLTLGQVVEALAPQVSRSCPDCGYSLVGNTSGTCPECGVRTR